MSDDMRPSPDGEDADRRAPADHLAIARLQEELARLRRQVETEVRTRRVVIVDERGADRIRLSASAESGCVVGLLDPDGFERSALAADLEGGALRIASRPLGDEVVRVDVFARDPEDGAGAYVGVELVDAGTSVSGLTVIETRPPRTWTLAGPGPAEQKV
jgi:hypothetical protein